MARGWLQGRGHRNILAVAPDDTQYSSPRNIDGRIGYYCLAAETSISGGTWEAAYASAQVALTGAKRVQDGERAAFALCRPPGHHAAQDMFGGYCFLNNAAIAAQSCAMAARKRLRSSM